MSALVEACKSGDAKVAFELLSASGGYGERRSKSDANRIDWIDRKGNTPLMVASKHGHEECVLVLLDFGADVDASELFGGTALMMAAAGGHMDIAQMLFSAGASLTLKSRSGYTAKDYARIFGHSKIATWLEGQEHRGNLREANVQGTFLAVDEPTVQPTVSVIRRSKFRLAEAYAEAPPQVEPVLQERNVVPDQGFHPGFACDHSVACASTCAAGHD
jgi:hypothetical protein